MTPIDPASSGGRRPYDAIPAGTADPHAAPFSPHAVGSAPPDGSGQAAASGGGASHATLYDAAVAEVRSDRTAAYEEIASRPPLSEVAGMHPAIAKAPVATIQDFVDLGLFTEDELIGLHRANLPPHELGALYHEALTFMQSPEFRQQQAQLAGAQVPVDAAAGPGDAPAAAEAGTSSAWSRAWRDTFEDAFKEQGLDPRTRMGVIGQLRQMELGEADLQAALEHYTKSPAGLAELEAADEQVRAGRRMQDLAMFATAGAAIALGAGTTALARSQGNLVRALGRVAEGQGDDAARAAQRALDAIRSSGTMTAAMKAEAAAALRGAANSTNVLAHPLRRASLNAGARHLTPAARLPLRDAMQYGLWMRRGDSAAGALRGAAAGGGAVDDVARAGAGAVDDVARGAGMFSRASKALGPAGLALGAGLGVWGIRKTMEAEGGFGEESARMTGNVVGGLAGGVGGAAAGAAIGTAVLPVIGTGIGAIVGGIAGGIGFGKVGEEVGGFLKGLFD